MEGLHDRGLTVWLTGLPSAGKSTIAELVAEELRAYGDRRVEVLDGDVVRTHLSKGLGFSKEDRDENIRRIGFVASLLARNGVTVVVAVVSPYREARDAARAMHHRDGFLEVHVATPVEVCSERDVKGLYRKQREGRLQGLTGVDDPYEAPSSPELRLSTESETALRSAQRVLNLIRSSRARFNGAIEPSHREV
jgi:adenylylsulfate kinase